MGNKRSESKPIQPGLLSSLYFIHIKSFARVWCCVRGLSPDIYRCSRYVESVDMVIVGACDSDGSDKRRLCLRMVELANWNVGGREHPYLQSLWRRQSKALNLPEECRAKTLEKSGAAPPSVVLSRNIASLKRSTRWMGPGLRRVHRYYSI